MGIRHEKTAVADPGDAAGHGAAVDCNAFAETVAIADFRIGNLRGIVAVIFGIGSQRGKRIDRIVFTDFGMCSDPALSEQTRSRADHDIFFNDTVRPDFHGVRQLGVGRNNCGRMYFGHDKPL